MSGFISPSCPGSVRQSFQATPRDLYEPAMTRSPKHNRNPMPTRLPWCRKSCSLLSFVNDHGWPILQGRLLCNLDRSGSANSCPAHPVGNLFIGSSNGSSTSSFNLRRDPIGGTSIQRPYRFQGQGPSFPCQCRIPGCKALANRLSQPRLKDPSPKHLPEPCHIAAHGLSMADSSTNPDSPVSGPFSMLR